jgi:predicted metalloenzyme YecM
MPQEDAKVATSDPIADIIGDYRAFATMQRDRLVARGIDIAPYPLSHLAVRVPDWDLYVHQRTLLERHARANSENLWNGRPISLIVLAEPLDVLDGTPVSLIELIPPVHQRVYRMASSTSASSSVRTSTTSHKCIGPRSLASSSRVPTSSRTTSCSRTSPT